MFSIFKCLKAYRGGEVAWAVDNEVRLWAVPGETLNHSLTVGPAVMRETWVGDPRSRLSEGSFPMLCGWVQECVFSGNETVWGMGTWKKYH